MRRRLPIDRVEGLLATDRGLSAAEVTARRQRFGANEILERVRSPWRELVRDTARDPMVWFLAGTGLIYALIGEMAEALALSLAIVPLVAMDVYLHHRTQASTEGLRGRLATRATVRRNGVTIEIPATDIVPGDLAIVGCGESLPADGLFRAGDGLQVDESPLTGEAYPVRKRPATEIDDGRAEIPVDGEHWGFAGTRLLTGCAELRVVFTGGETLYGEIIQSATRGAGGRTPLQQAIANLVTVLSAATVVLCLILAFVRLRQGYGWVDALMSAVTLAVAALPEEFPVVFTFFLGVGVYRLARRRALVRRAVSVENIGRVTTILSDKTGTITAGRLELTHVLPAEGISDERLRFLAQIASRPESGDPMDVSIAAGRAGTGAEALGTFPFTEGRKRESAVVHCADGTRLAATKGAAEVIFPMTTLGDDDLARWGRQASELAAAGHKVIACAWRPIDETAWPGGEPDRGLLFAGLLAFEDPVRAGVAEAVAICREAAIHPVMVTGDHPETAAAVAREIALGNGSPQVISGDELEERLGRGERDFLATLDVVARAVPAQKLGLVRAFREAGEVVVVTGDGVNDVPALQAADVGVAMGERGTQSAREIASIVLLDDDFGTLVRAIAEGRQLFANLRRSFEYLLLVHIPLVTTAALIPLAGYPLLYLPLHVVWLEIMIHPTAMLAFQDLPPTGRLEPASPERLVRVFAARDWVRISVVGAVLTILLVVGYVRSLGLASDVEHARAMTLGLLTYGSAFLMAALTGLRTPISRWIAAATIAISTALIELPFFAERLHLRPLHFDDWATVFLGGIAVAAVWLGLQSSMKTRSGPRQRAHGHLVPRRPG